MPSSRGSRVLCLGALFAGTLLLPSQATVRRSGPPDEAWKNHAALAEPDGQSHRGTRWSAQTSMISAYWLN
jgi:hypothetical protein